MASEEQVEGGQADVIKGSPECLGGQDPAGELLVPESSSSSQDAETTHAPNLDGSNGWEGEAPGAEGCAQYNEQGWQWGDYWGGILACTLSEWTARCTAACYCETCKRQFKDDKAVLFHFRDSYKHTSTVEQYEAGHALYLDECSSAGMDPLGWYSGGAVDEASYAAYVAYYSMDPAQQQQYAAQYAEAAAQYAADGGAAYYEGQEGEGAEEGACAHGEEEAEGQVEASGSSWSLEGDAASSLARSVPPLPLPLDSHSIASLCSSTSSFCYHEPGASVAVCPGVYTPAVTSSLFASLGGGKAKGASGKGKGCNGSDSDAAANSDASTEVASAGEATTPVYGGVDGYFAPGPHNYAAAAAGPQQQAQQQQQQQGGGKKQRGGATVAVVSASTLSRKGAAGAAPQQQQQQQGKKAGRKPALDYESAFPPLAGEAGATASAAGAAAATASPRRWAPTMSTRPLRVDAPAWTPGQGMPPASEKAVAAAAAAAAAAAPKPMPKPPAQQQQQQQPKQKGGQLQQQQQQQQSKGGAKGHGGAAHGGKGGAPAHGGKGGGAHAAGGKGGSNGSGSKGGKHAEQASGAKHGKGSNSNGSNSHQNQNQPSKKQQQQNQQQNQQQQNGGKGAPAVAARAPASAASAAPAAAASSNSATSAAAAAAAMPKPGMSWKSVLTKPAAPEAADPAAASAAAAPVAVPASPPVCEKRLRVDAPAWAPASSGAVASQAVAAV